MKAEWKLDDDYLDVKFWVDPGSLGEKCWEQLRNLRRLPFAVRHIAAMPDMHVGYGMPIGGILATDNVVVPNAVGVDIGCGMIAIRLLGISVEDIRNHAVTIRRRIKRTVPMGPKWHGTFCDGTEMPDMRPGPVVMNQYDAARKQLGTLGGGNHFIEIQVDQHGDVWIMIHSGSRNLGYTVAEYYNKWAIKENEKNFSQVLPKSDLAFFHRSHEGYDAYMNEMNYCIDFAKKSRAKMMKIILDELQTILDENLLVTKHVDICHNHASMENHLGKNVLVHRKGAAGPYFTGTLGIIPGSMGSKSFIVSHTGELMSFSSTSHGAGRPMSRTAAKKTLDLKAEQKILDDLGVLHNLHSNADLDEAHGAYKNIDEVMANQADLCNIEYSLTPVMSIKAKSRRRRGK